MFVDYKENVWISGNGMKDTNILKFTRNGKFLLQIGHHGKTAGNDDTENFNRPAGVVVYPKTNEVFVADGYNNRRVIVFDADTGAFKRQWGAYGNKPDEMLRALGHMKERAHANSICCTEFGFLTMVSFMLPIE